jgi:hypothetical protein
MVRGVAIGFFGVMLGAAPGLAQTDTAPPDAIAAAIRGSFAAVLPFPEATADGLPANGDAAPLWTVRWPAGDERTIEVTANPLNVANQKRAAQAEVEIQNAVRVAQQRSQSDYERALAEFTRGERKTSPIREVSLFDDGVTGERFDAETRLTIVVHVAPPTLDYEVSSSLEPSVSTLAPGVVAVGVASNTYRTPSSPEEPARSRFAPAQARVFIGTHRPPEIREHEDDRFAVTIRQPGVAEPLPVVVAVSGNGELVQDVLRGADWTRLQSLPRD